VGVPYEHVSDNSDRPAGALLAVMLSSAFVCRADEVYTGGMTADIDREILGYVWVEDAAVNLLPGAHIKNDYYMGDVIAVSGAVLNIYGGQIDNTLVITTAHNGLADPVVTIYGTDFAVNGTAVEAGTSELHLPYQLLSGVYGDGSPFAIWVECFAEGTKRLTIHLVWLDSTPPEPEPEPEPAIEVSAANVDFGQVNIGGFCEQLLMVSNTGQAPLTITSVYLEQDDNLQFYTTGLRQMPWTLAAGESAAVGVLFASAVEGQTSAVLVLLSDDPNTARLEIALTGEGIVFLTCSQQMEAILAFFDESVSQGTLFGQGHGKAALCRVEAVRQLLKTAQVLIERQRCEMAALTLKAVLLKVDGEGRPGDFVCGPAVGQLESKIRRLIEDLKKQ